MIFAVLMLLDAPSPPTLSAVEAVSPAAAGAMLLAGQDHGPITAVDHPSVHVMGPPGVIEIQLVERSVAGPGGCVRRRWTARFKQSPGAPRGDAVFDTARAATEVARKRNGRCPGTGYAGLSPGLDAEQALAALKHLDEVRAPRSTARFACTNSTASPLCGGDWKIRRELATLAPWQINRQGDAMVIWLGEPGQQVTEVRFDPATPARIAVNRRIPAPF